MLYVIVMGFWKNVEDRRVYLGITRKDLAQQAGIKYAVIGAGLERDSIPAANTALRISKVLKIPLENLLDEDFSFDSKLTQLSKFTNRESYALKYWNVYEDFEKLPVKTRQTIIEMIHKLALDVDS